MMHSHEQKEEKEEDASHRNILMLPWLAHGHLTPYLELAKRLSHCNMTVHLCSTPVNFKSLESQLNYSAYPSIKLVDLNLPSLPSLTSSNLHTTKNLPSNLMPELKTAFDLSKGEFKKVLEDVKPDLVLYDFIQPWAPRVADELKIPAVLFLTTGAAATAFFVHYLTKPDEKFPFHQISQSMEEDVMNTDVLRRIAHGSSNGQRLLECIEQSANFVIIKTFREIESKYINYLSSLISKELVPAGPLVPDTVDEIHEGTMHIIDWLDRKERSSVLFVSFGSEYFLKDEEMEEIACGLELSKVNFIWVVRQPNEEEKTHSSRHLPCGFKDRMKDKGLILDGWAPQREILSHTSIGGFLTHCGWNSIMEAMRFGVPIIALPLQLDQPRNAKLVSEIGVGVEIKGEIHSNKLQKRYNREDIMEGITSVMSEGVSEVRRKAKEISKLMGFKGNEEISFLVEKIGMLCTGVKRDIKVPDLVTE